MQHYKLIYDYKNDRKYREGFNKLAEQTYGIEFENWYNKGFWDDRYICYSYADGERIIANVSVHKMDLLINGEEKKAIQIGTVMADENYRGKGLIKSLLNTVIEKYEQTHDLIYLFANEDVLDFYPKFGFKRIEETSFSLPVDVASANSINLKKLDFSDEDNFKKLLQITKGRKPVSNTLGTQNDQHLLMFYFLLGFENNIFYLEEEDVFVVFEIEEDILHLYDVISSKKINLNDILEKILSKEIKKVAFHFTPDLNDKNLEQAPKQDYLFIRTTTVEMPKNFLFPEMSEG